METVSMAVAAVLCGMAAAWTAGYAAGRAQAQAQAQAQASRMRVLLVRWCRISLR